MKCPKCGSKNSDTNRFCRSCGGKLESTVERDPQIAPDMVVDEVALGEKLFGVWQLYSSGDTNAAMTRLQEVSSAYPERSSIHSMYALIYERMAELELVAGNTEAARSLLHQALDRYEKIVAMNPQSREDREKLASLRKKLRVAEPDTRANPVAAAAAGLVATVSSLPPRVLAAIGAAILILVATAGFIWAPRGDQRGSRASIEDVRPLQSDQGEVRVTEQPDTASEPPLSIYRFPAQETPATQPVPQTPASAEKPKPPPTPPTVEPVKIPSLPSGAARTAPASANRPGVGVVTRAPEREPEEEEPVDGSTTFARAILLHNQGLTQQAIVAAQQAIVLFDQEAASGKNAVAARRGAENAKKMISVWQSRED